MARIYSSSLMKRLISGFTLTALITIAVVSSLSFYYARRAINEAVFNHLSSVNASKKSQVIKYLKLRFNDIDVFEHSKDLQEALAKLKAYDEAMQINSAAKFEISSKEYKAIYQDIEKFFKDFVTIYHYSDLYFICDQGNIMFSTSQGRDLGENLSSGNLRDTALGQLWSRITKEKKAILTNLSIYPPLGTPVAFIGAPIYDEKKGLAAIIVLQFDAKDLDEIMHEREGMGETGESYLVGDDLLMRSDSRFESASTIMKKKIDTVGVHEALKDNVDTAIMSNYRGVEVLCSYSHLSLNEELGTDFEWAILSEIEKSEAFAPVTYLLRQIFIIAVFLVLIAFVSGYWISKTIATPLVEGANSLATSIAEISSTTSELATSSAQTSTSIAEISTTVEEVRQTVQLSNEKAAQVVERSNQVAQIADTGKKSTEDTIDGIKRIKDEMEYVAESIVKLSEQTQSIGHIIGAVTDLADQSNLLSVNAAIEAAKAGEQGKGFAVVAQEVKTLAEQSKDATNQVKTILNDIQKATSAAVMATERGGKAVETGVKLSAQAGEIIRTLANSITDSAQAAVQIASSSQQQLTGTEQLVQAMENIKDASIQNVDGAKQLETALQNLNMLASKLKALAG